VETSSHHPETTDFVRVVMNSTLYLIRVKDVRGLIRPVPITPVPMAPNHLMGVANVRGQIFCIIDPGKILRLNHAPKKTRKSRILLLSHSCVHLGLWVEDVQDFHRIEDGNLCEDESDIYSLGAIETKCGALPVLRTSALLD